MIMVKEELSEGAACSVLMSDDAAVQWWADFTLYSTG